VDTLTFDQPGQTPGQGPGRRAKPPVTAARQPLSTDTIFRSAGLAVTLLAVLVLGFVGYLYFLSGVQEARAQTTLYAQLRGELAAGTAPARPVIPGHPADPASLAAAPGDPVAVLAIPALGVQNMVVVEGTSPENLTLGPGHLRSSVLPGQAGISVIFGRRATFGAPFSGLPSLRSGALITVTTSQGSAKYQVVSVADSSKPIPFRSYPNQILLVTADSSVAPAHYVEVEAKLLGKPFPESGYLPQVGSPEAALGRDFYALIPGMSWAIALAAAALLGSFLAARWARWPAWIVTIPVLLAIVWNLYQAMSALLPNLY
jgi:LPXTG-site transpeptidase (sortase) family protein